MGRHNQIETYLEKLGFELVEDGTDALNYGVTVYEKRTKKDLMTITINYELIK